MSLNRLHDSNNTTVVGLSISRWLNCSLMTLWIQVERDISSSLLTFLYHRGVRTCQRVYYFDQYSTLSIRYQLTGWRGLTPYIFVDLLGIVKMRSVHHLSWGARTKNRAIHGFAEGCQLHWIRRWRWHWRSSGYHVLFRCRQNLEPRWGCVWIFEMAEGAAHRRSSFGTFNAILISRSSAPSWPRQYCAFSSNQSQTPLNLGKMETVKTNKGDLVVESPFSNS